MKIVFWGEERQSGTTSNMLAVAEMLSLLRPDARIVVSSIGGKKRVVSSDREGLGAAKKQKDAANKPEINKNEADFYFLDCGNGKDDRKREVLRKADLVVVNLIQEERLLREFFLYDIHIAPNILILLGRYCSGSKYDREYLEWAYRMAPERFGVISHSVRLQEAAQRGRIRRFIKVESRMPEGEINRQLLGELRGFAELIIKNAEEPFDETFACPVLKWERAVQEIPAKRKRTKNTKSMENTKNIRRN